MVDEAQTLRRLLDVALALGAERRTEPMLQRILAAARELAGAEYAAIGVPDGNGGFALFLTSGVDAQTWERIGALPRTHGVLGAILYSPEAIRMPDITQDPRFGYYPRHHPVMRSFLGVPIVAGGEVLAELYLAEKTGAPEFTEDDERVVGMLAAHAALAVSTAQRAERARELSVAQERNRLARDLHDSITQTLFSLSLAAESATALRGLDGRGGGGVAGGADRVGGADGGDGEGGADSGGGADGGGGGGGADRVGGADGGGGGKLAEQLARVRLLSATALTELRSLVETLRPPDVDAEGLAAALRKRVALLRRVHDTPIELTVRGAARRPTRTVEREVLQVANEALANALQHAEAGRVTVTLEIAERLVRLEVADDGIGFDRAEVRRSSGRFGLTSMRERAEALGGVLRVETEPGEGTVVRLEVPGDC
jgi:signal transduction histidine kinase